LYRIVVSRSAEKDLKRLSTSIFKRVAVKIDTLAENPRPSGSKKLKGTQDELWRIRVGDYRIIYEIGDELKLVDIRRIRHRKDVYDH
jgi:mRNA interferase RelE/StbE